MLVDVTPLGVTGKEAEPLLDEIGITVNKNAIPFDPLPPNTASGIRLGTPATTTRGFGPAEMRAHRAADHGRHRAAVTKPAVGIGSPPRSRDIVARFPVPGLFSRAPGDLLRDRRPGRSRSSSSASSLAALVALRRDAVHPAASSAASGSSTTPTSAVSTTGRSRAAGGVAVVIAFVLVGGAIVLFDGAAGAAASPAIEPANLVGLFVGAVLGAVFGAIDDLFDLRARWQFLGQLVLAGVAVLSGITVPFIGNPFGADTIQFAVPVGIAFTVVWIVGMINSLNFIDGLDGLSSGIALIAAVTLGVLSLTTQVNQPLVAMLCFVLAGGLLGLPALELPPGRDLPGHGRGCSSATRSRCSRSWARRRSCRPAGPRGADHRHVLGHRSPRLRGPLAVQPRSGPHPPSAARPGAFASLDGLAHLRRLRDAWPDVPASSRARRGSSRSLVRSSSSARSPSRSATGLRRPRRERGTAPTLETGPWAEAVQGIR